MTNETLTAHLNGRPGCSCRDARAALISAMKGTPPPQETCRVHSDVGRAEALQTARIDALGELAREARGRTAQTAALNSPKLTDLVRAAFETPTATDTETTA